MAYLHPTYSLPPPTAPPLNSRPRLSETKSRFVRTCFHSPTNARNSSKVSPEDKIKALERQLALAKTQLSSAETANQALISEIQEARVEVVQLKSVVGRLSHQVLHTTDSITSLRSSDTQTQLSVQNSLQSLRRMQNQYLCTGLDANSARKVWQWYIAHVGSSTTNSTASQSPVGERRDRGELRNVLEVLLHKWTVNIVRTRRDFNESRTRSAALTVQAASLCNHFNGIALQNAVILAEKRYLHSESLEKHLSELNCSIDLLTVSLQQDQCTIQSHQFTIKGELELSQNHKKDLKEQLEALKKQKAMKSIDKLRLERAFLAVLGGVKKLKVLEMLKERGIRCRMSEELRTEELETASLATIQRLFRVLDDKIMQILEKHKRVQVAIPSLLIPVSKRFTASASLIVPPSIEEMLRRPFQWSNVPGGEAYRSHRVLISARSSQN